MTHFTNVSLTTFCYAIDCYSSSSSTKPIWILEQELIRNDKLQGLEHLAHLNQINLHAHIMPTRISMLLLLLLVDLDKHRLKSTEVCKKNEFR